VSTGIRFVYVPVPYQRTISPCKEKSQIEGKKIPTNKFMQEKGFILFPTYGIVIHCTGKWIWIKVKYETYEKYDRKIEGFEMFIAGTAALVQERESVWFLSLPSLPEICGKQVPVV
jgi:hypothetical protein